MKLLNFSRISKEISFGGIVALPTILVIGGIIVEIGLAGVLIAYLVSQSGFGVKLSSEAMAAARAGINDAIIKSVRNYDSSASTTITVGNYAAETSVIRNPSTDKYTVYSIGTALNKKRKLKAILNVNDITREIKIESITEEPL